PRLLPNPYRGLEPFDEQHADYLFGRDDEIARITAALQDRPLVAVVGRSGVGKSSIVRAGVVPRLRADGTRVVVVRMTGAQSPVDVVAQALTSLVPAGDPLRSATRMKTALDDAHGPHAIAKKSAEQGPAVLLVDQFEELP